MKEKLIDTGKAKYVARDFPLPNHPFAFKACVAAHCAEEQGKFWEMSEKIFENFRALQPENLPKYAGEVGLDVAAFETCLESGKFDDKINQGKAEAQKAGIGSTPNFLVGLTQEGSTKFKASELIKGAYPFANFEQAVNKLIEEKKKGAGKADE